MSQQARTTKKPKGKNEVRVRDLKAKRDARAAVIIALRESLQRLRQRWTHEKKTTLTA